MKLKKILPIMAALLLTITACSEQRYKLSTEDLTPRFSTAPTTRMHDATWNDGDEIGISMIKNGEEIANKSNHRYKIEGTDVKPSGEALTYPVDESEVDIIAYYPYQSEIQEANYKIDLADQSDFTKIDLIYSNNAKRKKAGEKDIELTFSHQLIELNINVKTTDTEDEVGIEIYTATEGEFNLLTGKLTPDENSKAVITTNNEHKAFVMPGTEIEIRFTLSDKTVKRTISASQLQAGTRHKLNLTIKSNGDTHEVTEGIQPDEVEIFDELTTGKQL